METLAQLFPRACVLAGGLGTRPQPLTGDLPKALVPLGGRPLLEWILRWLERDGCKEAVLCLGYKADAIRAFVQETKFEMKFFFSVEAEPLGTGGALRQALPLLADEVLVINGDTLFATHLQPLLKFHQRHQADVTIALAHVDDASRYGAVEFDPEQRVLRFCEKQQQSGGWVSAGIYLMKRELVAETIPAGPCSLERTVFPGWVESKALFYAVPLPGLFVDIGTPEGYHEAVKHWNRFAPWTRAATEVRSRSPKI